jgi:hypothetical protein
MMLSGPLSHNWPVAIDPITVTSSQLARLVGGETLLFLFIARRHELRQGKPVRPWSAAATTSDGSFERNGVGAAGRLGDGMHVPIARPGRYHAPSGPVVFVQSGSTQDRRVTTVA